MSARQWKLRLEECQRKLGDATISASEWRDVAENRLTLIRRLDQTLSHNLEDLIRTGEIFGVTVILDDDVWTPTDGMDAGSVAMYIMGKIEAVAQYQKELLREASAVQITLNDTYKMACEAISVPRPTTDLTLPEETAMVDSPSSPYRELEQAINDIPGPCSLEDEGGSPDPPPRPSPSVKDAASSALALFRK